MSRFARVPDHPVPCAEGPSAETYLFRRSLEGRFVGVGTSVCRSPACLWQPRTSSSRATRRRRHMLVPTPAT